MNNIKFPQLFDDFITAPSFQREGIKEFFRGQSAKKGVYTIFNQQFEPMYVGSSIDLGRRLPAHLRKGQRKLEGHFDEVLFIGIKYVEGDVLSKEKWFIRELNPKFNKYRYTSMSY
ncbi:GIY-YIG nuclease family protein [Domibacillus sp. 8LH]|uniref:GIY-YIG nuclease family protein n=1 Tax=Domibacillus sp. 8LH TaxID=3073900 RepID=UPI003180199A